MSYVGAPDFAPEAPTEIRGGFAMTHNQITGKSSSEREAKAPHVIGVHGASEYHGVATHSVSEVLRAAESAGATTKLVDLAEQTLPPYNPDRAMPEAAASFVEKLSQADAVVLATSVRHDSYSAVIKNALDYCDSEDLHDKTVGLLAVNEGSGPALSLEHLRTVCTMLDTWVVPMQVAIDATWEGNELPEESANALRELGHQVVNKR
jgi:NAD(P)H-dependent FMN reductase